MDEKINEVIGKNLRARRMAKGKTLTEMGRFLGVSYQQLQKYEKGTNRMSAESLVKLARHFGCTTDELCGLLPAPADTVGQELLQRLKAFKSPSLGRKILEVLVALEAKA